MAGLRSFNTSGFLTRRDAWATPLNWIWEQVRFSQAAEKVEFILAVAIHAQSGLPGPRTDCPQTMPTPPPSSPAFANRREEDRGSGPISHLQVLCSVSPLKLIRVTRLALACRID
jgi:hypothetical protein